MISSLYALVDKSVGNKKLSHLNRVATHEILSSLGRLQVLRKNMIALRNERIPAFQWILLYFIGAILLVTISFIPSYNVVLFSVLKGAFGAVVISVFILLHQLDNLKLFRGTIGKASAGDVIDILEGRR
jgi:hypothetical protein